MHGDLLSTIQQTRRPQFKKALSAVDLLPQDVWHLGLTRAEACTLLSDNQTAPEAAVKTALSACRSTPQDVWHLRPYKGRCMAIAVNNPTAPEAAVKKALSAVRSTPQEYGTSSGLTRADCMVLCWSMYPSKPRRTAN